MEIPRSLQLFIQIVECVDFCRQLSRQTLEILGVLLLEADQPAVEIFSAASSSEKVCEDSVKVVPLEGGVVF